MALIFPCLSLNPAHDKGVIDVVDNYLSIEQSRRRFRTVLLVSMQGS